MAKAVTVENFNYKYSDGTVALRDINLQIEKGGKVALIGPNGAGKSTLLLAIGGFLTGTGKITVQDIEMCKPNMKKIRHIMGAVFQNPDEQLFMPRLFDDVAFGPLNMALDTEEVKRRTLGALATVGLAGLENKEPHHLSAGQKRAAAIATILSMMPEIITMDEPDSNLDPRSRDNLINLLNSFDHTIIIASCSMNFVAKVCDTAILIDHGTVIAAGDSSKIMSDEKLMAAHGLEVPAIFAKRS